MNENGFASLGVNEFFEICGKRFEFAIRLHLLDRFRKTSRDLHSELGTRRHNKSCTF